MTIEDPVEYKIKGINQIQVNDKIGLTFDVGLRSILRQDPDIIMIGEIRDVETAKIAIRAASTGHLVISTMHTNNAISSINRLMEMKLPPYLISSTLIGVYYGRTAIYEILEINENLKHYINNWTNSCNIASIAIGNEMITFEDSARYLIENHITTQEECGLLEGI